jgi:hypothetical protein
MYVLALVLLTGYALVRRRSEPSWREAAAVGFGGLARDAVFLVWWPGFDFRYHWWTALCVFVVPLILRQGRIHGLSSGRARRT